MPTARLFFALWPDDGTRRALAQTAKALHRTSGGRVTRPDSIHLTLIFLGNVERTRIPEIVGLASEVKCQPFVMKIDRAAYWKHNKIAWAGCASVPDELAKLVAQLKCVLHDAGFEFDSRPFAAHVTLLRHADPPGELVNPDFSWPVDRFCLVESVQSDQGVRYQQLACWVLY